MQSRIEQAYLAALRNQDKALIKVLRYIKAALKNRRIEVQRELTEAEVRAVLQSEVKSRQQALELYEQGKRSDLAAIERQEIAVIRDFLPRPLSEAELQQEVTEMIAKLQAASLQDMGRVMQALKQKLGERADGRLLSSLVKAALRV